MPSVAGENRLYRDAGDISNSLAPSLDRVIENLESLRQLIGGVSAAEIDAAEKKAEQLQSHLAGLENSLRRIAEIKIKLAEVERQRIQNQKDFVKRKPPPNNLIPFPLAGKRRETAEAKRGDVLHPIVGTAKNGPTIPTAGPAGRSELSEIACAAAPVRLAEKKPEAARQHVDTSGGDRLVQAATTIHDGSKFASEFDQNLLEELIKDYGEFESLSKPVPSEGEPTGEIAPVASVKPVPAPEPVSGILVQQPKSHPARSATFDHAVRELVMSYGQVDIYATSDRARVLKKVIAAGAVLAGVIFGSYLFLSPSGSGRARQSSSMTEAVTKSALSAETQTFVLPAEAAAQPK